MIELVEKVKEEKQQFNGDEWLEQYRIFNDTSSFNWFWKTKILKMNLDLIVFIPEIIYLK